MSSSMSMCPDWQSHAIDGHAASANPAWQLVPNQPLKEAPVPRLCKYGDKV